MFMNENIVKCLHIYIYFFLTFLLYIVWVSAIRILVSIMQYTYYDCIKIGAQDQERESLTLRNQLDSKEAHHTHTYTHTPTHTHTHTHYNKQIF